MRRHVCQLMWVLFASVSSAMADAQETEYLFFEQRIRPVLEKHCYECHSAAAEDLKSGLMLDSKPGMLKGGDSGRPAIVPGDPKGSLLMAAINHQGEIKMPPPGKGEVLSASEIADFKAWIENGAPDPRTNAVVHVKTLRAQDHWAFLPVRPPAVPGAGQPVENPIDAFILAKLRERGLSMSTSADRRTLLRRLSFDVTGLPPTPDEIAVFLGDKSANAVEKVVDRLLASPRYGERWARHWLDVVRFAETTGFEVNTPRPNAWPYRDYVIRSLNEDKPYDQFVKEQLAGDAFGVEEATGFLVGGANDQVKSPDVVLTRQQRADELHDMVATTGSAFLGLTVGCARCHDHKFDPISQVDYFAMAGVFSGVQHGERQLLTRDHEKRLAEASVLRKRLSAIETEFSGFEPLCDNSLESDDKPSAARNERRFDPVEAKFVRFTIHQTQSHPTIGVIEPCLDELEIYRSGSEQNLALAANGATASTSGSYAGDPQHQLAHLNDGQYGNGRSWISNERGRGWVQIELPKVSSIDRIVWSRDRGGKHQDRVPSAYTIEVGTPENGGGTRWQRVAGPPAFRSAVHSRYNVDRFSPVRARFLRFTVLETTDLEPCLDELEVYTAEPSPRNVALASAGTQATASSVYPNATIHRLEHVNDGQYGNSRSWISSEAGKGWVQLEFPQSIVVDKVVWGRDREEKFADRLATKYKIEVAEDTNAWTTVASSIDRHHYVAGQSSSPWYAAEIEDQELSSKFLRLQKERKDLQARIAALSVVPMVYAGTFTTPEPIHRLHRGEVMQRRELVMPGALAAFGKPLKLSTNATDQERRLALGNWITDPANPLTARVIVNRLWQYHFGEGLVSTPSDFGINGAKPSHPELLDWLATQLVENGWRLKPMHRLILLSQTYQQASTSRTEALDRDANNRLLWRFSPRRLEAEPIRDTILMVSGKLDLTMGGPGYHVFEPNDNYVRVYEPKTDFGPAEWRRMIYQFKPRMQQDATFGAFDCPDGGQIAPRRGSSTTPLQALNLLNSSFVMQQAQFMAERLEREAVDADGQVRRAFALAFNREPSRSELAASKKFIAEQGLALFCRALLNANEFVYVF